MGSLWQDLTAGYVMEKTYLRGLGVALVTPMKSDGGVDSVSAKRLLEYVIGGGVDFLVALGTTGEAPTLNAEEQADFVRLVVGEVAGRMPVVVGMSGNDTRALVKRLENMDCSGVDYILSAVPSYNKPSQQGIIEHFRRVADVAQRPVILYNVPGRTGRNMTVKTALWLAHNVENLVGIKEASGDLAQVEAILAERPQGFAVLSGDDSLTLPLMVAVPQLFGRMVHTVQLGDFATARRIHLSFLELYQLLFAENNPAGIKAALASLGLCENNLRLPLVPVGDELYTRIASRIEVLSRDKAF